MADIDEKLLKLGRARADAAEFQRVRQQGRGRPILSIQVGGERIVVVGQTKHVGKWQTMPDFLTYYLQRTLGASWWNAEVAKDQHAQHPAIAWFRALDAVHRKHGSTGELFVTPWYGACGAILTLAYDIYTVAHNLDSDQAERSLGLLVERLRLADQFFGARHELRVAALLLRAGFHLTWQDEVGRGPDRYGEYVATFPSTGRAFWVECRMRQPESDSSRFTYTQLVRDALSKQTDLERLVFVELNVPDRSVREESGGWAYAAIKQLRTLESQPRMAHLPAAEVVISNFPDHHHLHEVGPAMELLMESFKSDRYRTGVSEDLWDAIQKRARDPELNSLWQSIQEHHFVPTTFDGSLFGIDESNRLLVGYRYELDDGVTGVLEEATVVEKSKHAYAVLRLDDDQRVIATIPLSDEELTSWRQHPETFFGTLRAFNPVIRDPLGLFDFFHGTLLDASKDDLLRQMADHADYQDLVQKSREELAVLRAYRTTLALYRKNPSSVAPAWQLRLKPVIER